MTPLFGANVSGAITWKVVVTRGRPTYVAFAVDGVVRWRDDAPPFVYGGGPRRLDTTKLHGGVHVLTAVAANGRELAKTTTRVSVSNASTRIYWGASWDANTWNLFESHAGKKVSIVHWGVAPPWEHDFNYWVPAFEQVRARGDLSLVSMASGSVPLRDIANGVYDSSLTTWAEQAKAYGHPFFLRWDWEMNGSWFAWGTTPSNQNTPADYVAAWRHIHDIFAQAGATNVTWVWCVNAEFTGSTPLAQLYPGDAYVDWTAFDAYNQSTATWWRSFSTIVASTYGHLLQIAQAKPIMVAETSSREVGGSKASWITDALATQLPQTFPKIKALVWFNWRIADSSGWSDWEIESSSSAQAAFANAIGSSYYAAGGGFGNLPLLSKIQPLP